MNIHYFQHVPFEGLDSMESWIRRGPHALGAKVYANADKEIGWFPVELMETAISRCP